MIQIHGNCRCISSNTFASGHSNVFFFRLSLWTGLLSAAVTLFPQLISSQQVIKDAAFLFANSACSVVFLALLKSESQKQRLEGKKTLTTMWHFPNQGEHPVSTCAIIIFNYMTTTKNQMIFYRGRRRLHFMINFTKLQTLEGRKAILHVWCFIKIIVLSDQARCFKSKHRQALFDMQGPKQQMLTAGCLEQRGSHLACLGANHETYWLRSHSATLTHDQSPAADSEFSKANIKGSVGHWDQKT